MSEIGGHTSIAASSRPRSFVRILVSVATATSTLLLSSCMYFPGVPLDVPMSMSVQDGSPVITWCYVPAKIVGFRVSYIPAGDESSVAIFDGEGELPVQKGDTFTAQELDSSWTASRETWTGKTSEVDEIGLTVSYVPTARVTQGTFMAQFDIPPDGIIDWPEGQWQWPTGEMSSAPCGMASARR